MGTEDDGGTGDDRKPESRCVHTHTEVGRGRKGARTDGLPLMGASRVSFSQEDTVAVAGLPWGV